MTLEKEIFKKGSTTYYWASKFFPKKAREDIFKLYSFVRVMDNFVDEFPAQPKKLHQAEKLRKTLLGRHSRLDRESSKSMDPLTPSYATGHGKSEDDILSMNEIQVVQNIVELTKKYDFKEEWLQAFYQSMKWDAEEHIYTTLDDTLAYIYGSAEVIGLMMSKILHLSSKATYAAQMQGRAMQFINFLRDIDEDNRLGRCYFPKEDLEKFKLNDLSQVSVKSKPAEFTNFVQFQLSRYELWQKEAHAGFGYIPKRYRISIATAVDGYNWTAAQIAINPQVVFEKKIKPTKQQLLLWAAKHTIF